MTRIEMHSSMISKTMMFLLRGWKSLVVTDIVFKLIAFLSLVPAVGMLFRLFLVLSGREVLADTDIARFFIHPLGIITLVVVGAALVMLFAIELATLMMVCIGVELGRVPRMRSVLGLVIARAKGLVALSARIVGTCLVIVLPGLAVGGVVIWWLLSEHDINFYLTTKPREFWVAVGVIGMVLLILALMLVYRLSGWVYAMPILVFEESDAKHALAESTRRVRGNRRQVLVTLAAWGMVNLAIRFALSWFIVLISQLVVAQTSGRLAVVALTLGVVMAVIWGVNVASGLVANITLATSLSALYVFERGREAISAPHWESISGARGWFRMTRQRLVLLTCVVPIVAALLGYSVLQGIRLEDRVEITAHRGGAFAAPENTLAAIDKGIEDGADWIEIDVQESRDGEVLVVHDSDLMKVANHPVKIWDADAVDLQSIDIGSYFDASFSDQRVPTLEEVLQLCRGRVGVNIELKYYGHTQDLERKVIEIVERNEMASEIVIMSLEAKGIAKVKSLRPEWTVGLLTAVVAGDLTRMEVDFLAVKDSIASAGFVQSAHRSGKTVSAWTLNDPYSMSLMISRGVDNLITDRPALARQVLAERIAMSPVERLALEIGSLLGIEPKISMQDASESD